MIDISAKSYRNPILWTLVALAVLVVIRGVIEVYVSRQLNNLVYQQTEDQQYQTKLDDVYLQLTNAESGQLGYLITQNNTYLAPYNIAIPKIKSDFGYLRVSPLSAQYLRQIDNLNYLANLKISELMMSISIMKTEGQAAAFNFVNSGTGLKLMQQIRSSSNKLESYQSQRLVNEEDSISDLSDFLNYIAPIGVLINLGLLYLIFYLARKAVLRERHLENTREQFISIASHQLRTPATAIKQYIYLLLEGFYGRLSRDQRKALKIIDDSNNRGINLANNLLTVTRAESGKIDLSKNPVDLQKLLVEVVDQYKAAAWHNKNQKIIVKTPKKPVLLLADPFYLRIVIDNLVDNACKYSERNKKIFITLRKRSDTITLSVRDQGVGISKDEAPMLFNKFSRLDKGFKNNSDGSGLGLYLVKQLVDLHGGKIDLESSLNKGSTFTITFKAA